MVEVFFFTPIWVCGLPNVALTGLFVLDFIDGDFGCSGFVFNLSLFICDDLINLSRPDFWDLTKPSAFIVFGDNVFTEGVECTDDRCAGCGVI